MQGRFWGVGEPNERENLFDARAAFFLRSLSRGILFRRLLGEGGNKKGPGVWQPRAFNSKEIRDAVAQNVSRSP